MNNDLIRTIINTAPQIVIAVASVVAGVWALHNYKLNQRIEAAKWVQSLYKDFDDSKKFYTMRVNLQYKYSDELEYLLQNRVTNRAIPLTESNMSTMYEVDTFLNYFEHILYLVDEKRIARRDVMTYFEHWFKVLNRPNYGAIRSYLSSHGWSRVVRELNSEKCLRVIIRSGDYVGIKSKLPSNIDTSRRSLSGSFKIGENVPEADQEFHIWTFANMNECANLLQILDEAFSFDPQNWRSAAVRRRCVRVSNGRSSFDAWVYEGHA